jgi:predicted nucleic acid-binding protein
MSVAADSGPLISLASISHLDLLHSLFDTIHIPNRVYHEVVIAGKGKIGSEGVAGAAWIERHVVKSKNAVARFIRDEGLDKGESEAVVLAKELNVGLLLVDDRIARNCAHDLNISVMGTCGVLLLAKENLLIPAVRKPLDDLLRGGFYLSSANYRRIIRLAEED